MQVGPQELMSPCAVCASRQRRKKNLRVVVRCSTFCSTYYTADKALGVSVGLTVSLTPRPRALRARAMASGFLQQASGKQFIHFRLA